MVVRAVEHEVIQAWDHHLPEHAAAALAAMQRSYQRIGGHPRKNLLHSRATEHVRAHILPRGRLAGGHRAAKKVRFG